MHDKNSLNKNELLFEILSSFKCSYFKRSYFCIKDCKDLDLPVLSYKVSVWSLNICCSSSLLSLHKRVIKFDRILISSFECWVKSHRDLDLEYSIRKSKVNVTDITTLRFFLKIVLFITSQGSDEQKHIFVDKMKTNLRRPFF